MGRDRISCFLLVSWAWTHLESIWSLYGSLPTYNGLVWCNFVSFWIGSPRAKIIRACDFWIDQSMKLLKLLFCSVKKGINKDCCVPATDFRSLLYITNPERTQKRNTYFVQYLLWNLQEQHFLLSEFVHVISGPLHSLYSHLGFVFCNKRAFSRMYTHLIYGLWAICFPPHPICCDISSNDVT